jgi:4-amino-4-deoxy-L-arabinose transferase-like glycosyltransferase
MARARVRLATLLLAALGLYLVGNASVPLLDRDEPRYAQCSRQMLQSGDWVVPRLFDDIRAKKPPLIYWLQASTMWAIGDTAFAARLPSVLAMLCCAFLLAIFVWRNQSPEHAFWTTLVFCSSALVIVAAKSSTTDAVRLLWIAIGEACVYWIWRGDRSWNVALILAIAIALELLTKGLIVGVLLSTILVLWIFSWLDRRPARKLADASPSICNLQFAICNPQFPPRPPARGSEEVRQAGSTPPPPQHSPGVPGEGENPIQDVPPGKVTGQQIAQLLVGLLTVATIVGSWLYLVNKRSPAFLPSMWQEAMGHAFKGMEGHGGPPGMHLLFIWADFLPWSLLLPAAIVIGWLHRGEPLTRFALAAVIGPWLLVELAIKTKLPQYMLPTFPALSVLTGNAIVRGLRGDGPHFSSPQFVGAARIWAGVIILIGLLPWLAALRFQSLPWVTMSLVSVGAIVWAILVVLLLQRKRGELGIAAVGIGMICLTALMYGLYLPRAQFLRLSILTASVLRQHNATAPGQSLMIDYKEPSLAFYEGGTIREQDSSILIHRHYDQWKPWMVITREVWKRLPPDAQNRLEVIADFRGLSVADSMRDVDVIIVRRR